MTLIFLLLDFWGVSKRGGEGVAFLYNFKGIDAMPVKLGFVYLIRN